MTFRDSVAQGLGKGDITVVRDPVERVGIPARVAEAEGSRRNPALLFENVSGGGKVLGNLFGSPARLCRALSARNYGELFARLDRAMAAPQPLRLADGTAADYLVEREPDLERCLPVTRYCLGDGTPYITSGIVLARFASSRRHVCFVRFAVLGGNRLLINPGTPRITRILDESIGQGRELDIRILIGVPAEIMLMACVSMTGSQDKLEVAQAMAGEGLSFSRDELPLPTSTEIVLRARVLPQYEREGPFGEVGGMYSIKQANPVCVVDEIWQRPGALFHSVSGGMSREHLELVSLGPRSFLERLKRDVAGVASYSLPQFGGDRLAVIAVKGGFDVRSVHERLWEIPIVRGFVFVNEDIGRSAADVLWALLQRAANRDHFAFSEQRHPVYNTDKFVVDATVADLDSWGNRRIEIFRPVEQGGA